MKFSVPLKALICVYLATDDDNIKSLIEQSIISDAAKRVKVRNPPGLKEMRKSIKAGAGEILPFEINPFDEAISYIIASDIRTKSHRKPEPHGYIYSSSSLIQGGAFRISYESAKYFDSWFDEEESEGLNFRLFPQEIYELKNCVEKLSSDSAKLSVDVSDRAKIFIHLPRGSSPTYEELFKAKYGAWTVSLIDPNSDSYNNSIRGLSIKVNPDSHTVEIDISSPEAILQLSAAASEKRWILLCLDQFAAFFRVPELDEDCSNIQVWTSSWDRSNLYLWAENSYQVQVDQDVIMDCCRKHHWFFWNIWKFPFHTLAKEISKT